jgi:hypothetical protein
VTYQDRGPSDRSITSLRDRDRDRDRGCPHRPDACSRCQIAPLFASSPERLSDFKQPTSLLLFSPRSESSNHDFPRQFQLRRQDSSIMGSSTTPPPSSLSGLVATLAPTFVVAVVYVLVFLCLRRSKRRYYAPRTYLGTLREE